MEKNALNMHVQVVLYTNFLEVGRWVGGFLHVDGYCLIGSLKDVPECTLTQGVSVLPSPTNP